MHRTLIAALALVAAVATVATSATAGGVPEPGALALPALAGGESGERTAAGAAVPSAAEARRQPSLRLFRAWLAAFNSGDRTRYARFLERNFPSWTPPMWLGDVGLREITGGFELRRVGRVSATRVSGWVQERDSDQFARFSLSVSAAKRPKILALDLVAIPRPAEFPIARLTEVKRSPASMRCSARRPQRTGSAVRRSSRRTAGFSSAAPTGRRIATRHREHARDALPHRLDEQDFTAVACSSSSRTGSSCSTTPSASISATTRTWTSPTKVTVRHLLTHTGGTGDIFGLEFDRTS